MIVALQRSLSRVPKGKRLNCNMWRNGNHFIVGTIAVTLSLSSIASLAKSVCVIEIENLPNGGKNILDLQFKKVELRETTILNALNGLKENIKTQSNRRFNFYFEVENSRAEKNDFLRRGIPWEKWKYRNPRVELSAVNTDLKKVIDQLCITAGWSYNLAPFGPVFVDDKSFPFPRRKH